MPIRPDEPHNDPAGRAPDGHLEDRKAERIETSKGFGFSLSAVFVDDTLPDVQLDVPPTIDAQAIDP